MTPWIYTIPAAFLAGTIPFGLLIGKAKGVDVRTQGSGNIGATNLGRILGRPYFFLCFTLDFLKGLAPVGVAGWMGGLFESRPLAAGNAWLWLAAMLAPVLGHVLNPWLKFKGGKGVATSLGALLAVWPYLTIPAAGVFLVFAIVLATGRIMSLASMAAGVSLPLIVLAWWATGSVGLAHNPPHPSREFSELVPFLLVSVLLAGLVVWTHRGNIRRLRAGTEPKLGQKPPQVGPPRL